MSRQKILIADDDPALVRLIATLLEHAGYEVTCAPDAYHALHLALESKPDLMLLDIHMPAGEGFSVQDRLRQSTAMKTPVIYLTGDSSAAVEAAARKLGAFAMVRKPFEADELLAAIGAALRERTTIPATNDVVEQRKIYADH